MAECAALVEKLNQEIAQLRIQIETLKLQASATLPQASMLLPPQTASVQASAPSFLSQLGSYAGKSLQTLGPVAAQAALAAAAAPKGQRSGAAFQNLLTSLPLPQQPLLPK